MRNQNFTTKETYLVYRSEWKAEYNQLSEDIRQLKNDIKDAQHNKEYAGSMQYALIKNKLEATCMLGELKTSKEESQNQYLTAHPPVVYSAVVIGA